MKKLQEGFSIIEVILAAAVFVTFASSAVVAVISAINTNRLGAEQTIANQYASEGIEAVRSIKNQSWTTFISKTDAGTTGVTNSSGVWAFSGTSDTLSSDSRFTRTITVSSVQRDSSGNIVSGSDTTQAGLTTKGSISDTFDGNAMNGSKYTIGATGGSVVSISVYVGAIDNAPNNQFALAIYTDNAGNPGTLIAHTNAGTLTANAWNTLPISATLAPNTSYWFFYETNSSSSSLNNLVYNSGGNAFGQGQTFGNWPASINLAPGASITFSMYVNLGGSIDPNTRKVTSTTTWNFTSARPESVILTSYLTNWAATIPSINNGDGFLVYGDTTSVAQPKYRYYTNSADTFSAESSTGTSFTDTAVGKTFKIKTSPTKQEAIAGYVNSSGVLRILCYDGTTWSNEWTTTVGGTATNDQRFGIAYEQTTGDVLIVYSTNAASSNELAYRTKLGSTGCGSANWSSATTITTARTTGVVQWIRMEPSPVSGSNTIAVAWADSNSDLSAMEWTGSSFGIAEPSSALETNLEKVSTSQDVQAFDIAMESLTGNLMIVWSPLVSTSCTVGSNCIKYARYTTAWSAAVAIPTVADEGTNIDISTNPTGNQIVMGAIANSSSDLSLAYWSGSAWTGVANVDTTTATPIAGSKLISTGWLTSGATTRSVIVYNDSSTTNIGWYIGNAGTFTAQTDFSPTPAFGNPQEWYDIQPDPKNKDRLMFTLSDVNSDLFAKRLVMTSVPAFTWSNSDGGVSLETNLGQATSAPFHFAYWRNP